MLHILKKLIIFDFDDTLTDNTQRDFESFNILINKFKLKKIPKYKIIKWRKSGQVSKTIISKMMLLEDNRLLNKYIKSRSQFLANPDSFIKYVKLKPKTKKILFDLKKQGHILVLNSIQPNNVEFQVVLKYFKIHSLFDKIYAAKLPLTKSTFTDRKNLKKKIYFKILSDFGFSNNKKNVLVIGNLFSDILPAQELQLNSILIKGSFGFDTSDFYPINKINSLDEILKYI